MASKTIKEIIIILLITLAIILVLGILLYEYMPSNKMIPEEVSYTTPEDIKQILAEEENTKNIEPITYSLEPRDIKNYERIDSYVPGKVNPFSSLSEKTENSDEGNTNNNNSGNSSSTNTGSSSNSASSGGHYLPDRGTK